MCVIMIILSPISWFILDEYGIRYRVMKKLLKKRWLYSAVTYSLLGGNGVKSHSINQSKSIINISRFNNLQKQVYNAL